MKKLNKNCQCIRCREPQNTQINFENIKLIRREYQASGGKEIFLSYEDVKNNKILAFLRLRITSEWTLPELKNAALIRELHTYGFMASLKKGVPTNVQHRGLGKKLMAEAERIVKQETNLKKIAVISGVGVRDYYRHLGYRLDKTYLIKTLKNRVFTGGHSFIFYLKVSRWNLIKNSILSITFCFNSAGLLATQTAKLYNSWLSVFNHLLFYREIPIKWLKLSFYCHSGRDNFYQQIK